MLFDFFKSKPHFLEIDVHSHLLAGIDDGVKTWDESISIIKELKLLGYQKLITTPHIIHNYYANTPEIIRSKLGELQELVKKENINITIEAAAEYYIDEHFFDYVKEKKELLTFGDQHVLVETGFMNKPAFLNDLFFELQSQGYRPILAHPERYIYLQNDFSIIEELSSLGVLLQINANSLIGYYSKSAKLLSEKLIKEKLIHFIGSDIHNHKHLKFYKKALKSKYFEKCRQQDLLNNSL